MFAKDSLWTLQDFTTLTWLYLKIFWNFYMWKAKTTSDTQNLLLIDTEVNIYLKSWTKFSLNNRQPPKALKFNHQPSKLEKTNHQPLRPSYLRRFFATKHFVIVASCIPLVNVTKNSPESYCLYSCQWWIRLALNEHASGVFFSNK